MDAEELLWRYRGGERDFTSVDLSGFKFGFSRPHRYCAQQRPIYARVNLTICLSQSRSVAQNQPF